ncbi:MAG TPA: L-threonylcarbamoyladenylate synthase [Luteibaculaceae bacterium]|nr:L-threonylcarbamoyladenylate synthase [Luteibaculaceae bacterium]
MIFKLYPDNVDPRRLKQAIDILQKGGVIVYPTDAVYCIGCDLLNHKAVERVARIKGVKVEKANFSLICRDLSNLAAYTKPLNSSVFRLMKQVLPGPFTFILPASNEVPRLFQSSKKTIGIRVPDNEITRALVEALGNPLISTSVHDDDDVVEYITDPELIHERYGDQVDLVIDGGYGLTEPTTIIDCTGETPEIIRQGLGIA